MGNGDTNGLNHISDRRFLLVGYLIHSIFWYLSDIFLFAKGFLPIRRRYDLFTIFWLYPNWLVLFYIHMNPEVILVTLMSSHAHTYLLVYIL